MLKIAVCIKQVPAFSEGAMDANRGVIKRDGLKNVINANDLPAIETALRIKEVMGDKVDAFTMGPKKAEEVLRVAFGMGVDDGYLLNDPKFSGADVLATSYTLIQGMKIVDEYDLVICGKQTSDGGTSQVGGSIAQWMAIPNANMVIEIVEIQKNYIVVKQQLDEEILTIQMPFPCLLSVAPSIYVPRMQTLKSKIAAKKKHIHLLQFDDMGDKNPSHYGLEGSATKVERIYPAQQTRNHDIIYFNKNESAPYIVQAIRDIIRA